jgi:hypothetical protein
MGDTVSNVYLLSYSEDWFSRCDSRCDFVVDNDRPWSGSLGVADQQRLMDCLENVSFFNGNIFTLDL